MIDRLRELPGITVPEVPAGIEPSWYTLPLVFAPEQADGLALATLVSALQKMPVPHENGTALDAYVDAFGKVISNRHFLMEE